MDSAPTTGSQKMACGATLTLKRSLEFEPMHSRPTKRQRCSLVHNSMMSRSSPMLSSEAPKSPFADAVPRLSSEELATKIGFEVKRLQSRRGRVLGSSSSHSMALADSGASTPIAIQSSSSLLSLGQTTSQSLTLSGAAGLSQSPRDTPVLSLRQVQLVVSRLLGEHEDRLREEYDKVLHEKLTEQYEAFLKFNYDQISRRFGETAASYVS